jgi:hypothetical protein
VVFNGQRNGSEVVQSKEENFLNPSSSQLARETMLADQAGGVEEKLPGVDHITAYKFKMSTSITSLAEQGKLIGKLGIARNVTLLNM